MNMIERGLIPFAISFALRAAQDTSKTPKLSFEATRILMEPSRKTVSQSVQALVRRS